MKSNRNAGQFNLRGKKDKLLRCGCCIIFNKKHEIKDTQVKQELRKYNPGIDHDWYQDENGEYVVYSHRNW